MNRIGKLYFSVKSFLLMVIVICLRGFSALFYMTTDLMGFQSKSVIHFRGRRKRPKKLFNLLVKRKLKNIVGINITLIKLFSLSNNDGSVGCRLNMKIF